MSTEITEAGYQSLRNLIDSSATISDQWDYIALIDDAGNEVTRVSITGDSRTSWQHAAGDQVLQVRFEITGSDADIPLPVTIVESRLHDTSSGGDILASDTFYDMAFSSDSDQGLVEHYIEVPQVP